MVQAGQVLIRVLYGTCPGSTYATTRKKKRAWLSLLMKAHAFPASPIALLVANYSPPQK